MDEHEDDLESDVSEGAAFEKDEYPNPAEDGGDEHTPSESLPARGEPDEEEPALPDI